MPLAPLSGSSLPGVGNRRPRLRQAFRLKVLLPPRCVIEIAQVFLVDVRPAGQVRPCSPSAWKSLRRSQPRAPSSSCPCSRSRSQWSCWRPESGKRPATRPQPSRNRPGQVPPPSSPITSSIQSTGPAGDPRAGAVHGRVLRKGVRRPGLPVSVGPLAQQGQLGLQTAGLFLQLQDAPDAGQVQPVGGQRADLLERGRRRGRIPGGSRPRCAPGRPALPARRSAASAGATRPARPRPRC